MAETTYIRMQVKLSKKDIVWSYIGTILNMGTNFLMLPIIMNYLDGEMLGLWYVFMSIGTIAMLFDVGFGVTFSRNITYCWSGAKEIKAIDVAISDDSEPDFFLMKKVIKACEIVYLRLSGAALLLLLTLGTFYLYQISKPIVGQSHYFAWVIFSVAVFLNLYYGYYATFLRGVGAVDQANKNVVISRLCQLLLTALLLALGCGIIGVCLAYLSYGTLFRLLGKYKFYNYCGIGECLEKVDVKIEHSEITQLVKTIWHNAWRDGIISISNFLSNQACTIICSLYLTLTETGAYSIGVQLAMAIATISGTLYMTYQPALQSAYSTGNKEKMKEDMSLIVVSLIYFFIIGVAGTAIVILPVLSYIKPESVITTSIFLVLCLYHFILKFRDCYTSYFSCTNRILYMKSFVVSSVVCVILSFVLVGTNSLGVWGLIIAQIISQIVYNFWYWPMKAHAELELSLHEVFVIGNILILKKLKIKQ